MAGRLDWFLLFGAATGSSMLAPACAPAAPSCTETATCEPSVRKDAGIDAPDDVEAGDEGSNPDISIDTVDPPRDSGVDPFIDSRTPEDSEGGRSEDARHDRTDVMDLADVPTEPDAACDPGTAKSPVENACLISEKYGVFVSPLGSDTTGIGTRAAPYKTLIRALQTARGNVMRVYACDEGTGYLEALTIDATLDGMAIYGGFECSGWTYDITRRARVHPATGVALSVKGLTAGLTLEDFEFNAADAAPGMSSMGAIVDTSLGVTLKGVKISAGKGGVGVDGADGAPGADGNDVEPPQHGYGAVCPSGAGAQVGGSWGNSSGCKSLGGAGGQSAKNNSGAAGFFGGPQTAVTPPNVDNGGASGPTGQDGDAGSRGDPGTNGAANTAVGTFSAAGYSAPPAGGDGVVGKVGQGGGGGGASNAWLGSDCIGATGGAGGMGGCGGSPGMGGASAGASVALLSWMSPLTLDHCDITAAPGGAGGKGGNGGKGGAGKDGAPGGAGYGDAGVGSDAGTEPGPGGKGGTGGNGGPGGSGAGGNGGPSYAIVHKGTAPTKLNGTLLLPGAGGAKGIGGQVDATSAPDGLPGDAAEEFAVP